MLQKITPCLWFDGKAKEAAEFYTGVFKDSKILSTNPMVVMFELEGQKFMGLNGGPKFQFTEALSFFVSTETQDETDYYWDKLVEDGGCESKCAWLKDKFGLSWQIVPTALVKLLSDHDKDKAKRVMEAMLKMNKIIIKDLEEA